MLSLVPNTIMPRIMYYLKLHRKLKLNKPERFSEYIQCYIQY
jgi:hypothetical protein